MASILELDLCDVPDIGPIDGWQKQWHCWLKEHGFITLNLPYPYEEGLLDEHRPMLMPGYTILAVLSPKFAPSLHAVVCLDGEVVHDPQPAYDGTVDLDAHDFIRDRSNWREYEVFVALPKRLLVTAGGKP